MLFNTARKRSCGKVMFLHLSVILFTGGGCLPLGRGCLPLGPGGCLPLGPGVYTPLADTPLGRHPSSAPSIEMTIEAAGMRPTGMHSYCEHNLNCLVVLLAQRKPIAYPVIVGLKDKKRRSPIPLALTFL